jgi:indolepyruvate ferredoxin oxidoreductase
MAAHLEGKGVGVLDMAGLAQKGGAVASHIRIAEKPEDIHAIRIAAREADLVLGGDIVVAGSRKVLAAVEPGVTTMVIDRAEVLPGEFTRNADFSLPTERLKRALTAAAGAPATHFLDASRIASAVTGGTIAANMVMLGYAYQLGTLPLSAEAIETAIKLNGEAAEMNITAFRFGRCAAAEPAAVEKLAAPSAAATDARTLSQSFDEMVARRVAYLTAYQNVAYAKRYRDRVEAAKAAEAAKAPGKCGFAEAVARNLFKLMAYKDEYEVARLYGDGAFLRQVAQEFDGERLRFSFQLAPPLLARPDPRTGVPRKMTFGPWMLRAFRLLMRFKFLRGTILDPFGYSAERRLERKLIADYEATLKELLAGLDADNHHLAVGIAVIPEKIRGYGHVKRRHLEAAKADEATLLDQFRSPHPHHLKAAE